MFNLSQLNIQPEPIKYPCCTTSFILFLLLIWILKPKSRYAVISLVTVSVTPSPHDTLVGHRADAFLNMLFSILSRTPGFLLFLDCWLTNQCGLPAPAVWPPRVRSWECAHWLYSSAPRGTSAHPQRHSQGGCVPGSSGAHPQRERHDQRFQTSHTRYRAHSSSLTMSSESARNSLLFVCVILAFPASSDWSHYLQMFSSVEYTYITNAYVSTIELSKCSQLMT